MTTETRAHRIEHTIGRDGLFVIRLRDGDVRLRGTDGETATIRSTDGRSLEGFGVEAGDRSLSIGVPSHGSDRGIGRTAKRGIRSPELEVDLPAGSTVVVEGASADVEASGLSGDQRYRSASGDLTLRGVRGTLAVEAVSGDVEILADGPSEFTIRTVSGDLAIRAGDIGALRATTTSGDVHVAGRFVASGPYTIETVSGDAVVASVDGLRVEVKTIAGDVRTELDAHYEDHDGRRTLVIGGGGPTLGFRSTSGDLRIVRAGELPTPVAPPVPAAPLAPTAPSAPAAPAAPTAFTDEAGDDTLDDDPAEAERLDILHALERGEIDVTEAGRRLEGLEIDAEDRTDA
ncbi:MAG TPA: DUF4097 family beta strand repeat-containing protein [Candidatus Saccharimonadales bacterium]|nr:DUF4097 family beta strand repeat-containing protein [Candidatus Saccharimonadales bacterium]